MGKMLIIKGASYTPSTGNNNNNNNNNNQGGNGQTVTPTPTPTPTPSTSDYVIFYQSADDSKWYADRSQVESVKGIGFAVMDVWESEIVSVTNPPVEKITRALLFMGDRTGSSLGWDTGVIANPMGSVTLPQHVDHVTAVPDNARNIFVWIDDNGSTMSETRLNTVLQLAKSNIIFNHG